MVESLQPGPKLNITFTFLRCYKSEEVTLFGRNFLKHPVFVLVYCLWILCITFIHNCWISFRQKVYDNMIFKSKLSYLQIDNFLYSCFFDVLPFRSDEAWSQSPGLQTSYFWVQHINTKQNKTLEMNLKYLLGFQDLKSYQRTCIKFCWGYITTNIG